MAQRRMVSKRLTQSAKISVDLQGNDTARFVYVALLPYTDPKGRVSVNPYGLAGTIFEAFEYTAEDLAAALQALADVGLLKLYQTKTHKLIAEYIKFTDFNTPHKREGDSDFPNPGSAGTNAVSDVHEATSVPLPVKVPESSGNPPANVGGKSTAELKGTEWKKTSTEVSTGDPPNEAGSAPIGGVPPERQAWLNDRLAQIENTDMPQASKDYTRRAAIKKAQQPNEAWQLDELTNQLRILS